MTLRFTSFKGGMRRLSMNKKTSTNSEITIAAEATIGAGSADP